MKETITYKLLIIEPAAEQQSAQLRRSVQQKNNKMSKIIQDYLHLYLGCEVDTNITWGSELIPIREISVTELNLIIDALERKERFQGDYEHIYCKPILRPLSSMTEDEVNECWKRLNWSENITTTERRRYLLNEEFLDSDEGRECGWLSFCGLLPYLLKQSFDLFGLIESGLAIDKTKSI